MGSTPGLHIVTGAFGFTGKYLFHLRRDHPFVDGNKRTALAAAEIFLDLNGARLRATNAELERLTRRVAEGQASKADVVRFLEERVTQD